MDAKYICPAQNGRQMIEVDAELFCLLTGMDLARDLQPHSALKIATAVRHAKLNHEIELATDRIASLRSSRKPSSPPETWSVEEALGRLGPGELAHVSRYTKAELADYLWKREHGDRVPQQPYYKAA